MVLDPWLMILPWHLGCHYLPSPPPMPDFLVTLSQLILTCWVLKVALVNTLTGWVSIFAASCYLADRLSLDNYKHCLNAVMFNLRCTIRNQRCGSINALAKNVQMMFSMQLPI